MTVEELLKSTLLDTGMHAYRPSLVVVALFEAAIELQVRSLLVESDVSLKAAQLQSLCSIMQRVRAELFGR